MRVSFNGGIVPYYYRCPKSFKLRNKDRIYMPDTNMTEKDVENHPRFEGIRNHKVVQKFFNEDFADLPDELKTETILDAKLRMRINQKTVGVERTLYTDSEFNPLPVPPSIKEFKKQDIVTGTPDLFIIDKDDQLFLYDWKFGNSRFGVRQYKHEISFFACLIFAHYPDIQLIRCIVHYPLEDYTLPIDDIDGQHFFLRMLGCTETVTSMLEDPLYLPKPSPTRCQFCDYRPKEVGGLGNCEEAVI